jgi:hypothetical protein
MKDHIRPYEAQWYVSVDFCQMQFFKYVFLLLLERNELLLIPEIEVIKGRTDLPLVI